MAAKRTKAVEVDGITVKVDPERLEDYELVEAIAEASSDEGDDMSRLAASVRMFKLILGDCYGDVKTQLREKRGGKLSVQDMVEFSVAVLNGAGAKN